MRIGASLGGELHERPGERPVDQMTRPVICMKFGPSDQAFQSAPCILCGEIPHRLLGCIGGCDDVDSIRVLPEFEQRCVNAIRR